MRHCQVRFLFLLILSLVLSCSTVAQTWVFSKEKDGIMMYTKKNPGKSLKSYKGITDIMAPADKVFSFIEDIHNTLVADKNLSQIKVMLYEKNKRAQYYLVYDLSWPLTDRDLCVEVKVTIDTVTGVNRITTIPLAGVIPERAGMIRINDYHQVWTIRPAGKEMTHVDLEGYADPGGSIPDWISNMVIVDTPYKVLSAVKKRLEKKQAK
jgi:hypothetical protein